MKARILWIAICTVALSAFAHAQSGVAGKWVGETQGRGGGAQTLTLTLQVDGSAVTGSIDQGQGPVAISDGKLDGAKVTFSQILSFNGMEITVNWSGEQNGDEMTLTRAGGAGGGGRGGGRGGGGPITLKRAN